MKTRLIDQDGNISYRNIKQNRIGYFKSDSTVLAPHYSKYAHIMFRMVHKVSAFILGIICRIDNLLPYKLTK
jgi:hypothetical protein